MRCLGINYDCHRSEHFACGGGSFVEIHQVCIISYRDDPMLPQAYAERIASLDMLVQPFVLRTDAVPLDM